MYHLNLIMVKFERGNAFPKYLKQAYVCYWYIVYVSNQLNVNMEEVLSKRNCKKFYSEGYTYIFDRYSVDGVSILMKVYIILHTAVTNKIFIGLLYLLTYYLINFSDDTVLVVWITRQVQSTNTWD